MKYEVNGMTMVFPDDITEEELLQSNTRKVKQSLSLVGNLLKLGKVMEHHINY